MSSITEITNLESRIKKIEADYDELFNNTLEDIPIESKALSSALKEQIVIQMEWEIIMSRAKYARDQAELLKDESHAEATTTEMRDKHKMNTITEAKVYANSDDTHKKAKRLYIRALGIYDQIRGVHEVITTRKYTLNNLTNAVIASVDNHII